jgi:hypothetical protein
MIKSSDEWMCVCVIYLGKGEKIKELLQLWGYHLKLQEWKDLTGMC